jgi:CelD/BcsL family acetyltransferase involved in cellulose biosynthesis
VWTTDEAGFRAQRKAWNRVPSRGGGRSVFLRHEWFDAAWQWRKDEGCSLRIASLFRGRELIGICPLVLTGTTIGGFPVRRLEFLSVPDSQFCDIICDRENAPEVREALAAALVDIAGEWDILELRLVPEDSVAAGMAGNVRSKVKLDCERIPWDSNPFIDLTTSWADFYGQRTRSLKKANNLSANRLRKAGALEIEWLRDGLQTPHRVDTLLAEFVALSARSWKSETALTLNNPRPGAFIRCLTRHAFEQGWLSTWGLRLDGRLVAMEYQLICGGEVFALRADFDQSLDTISPGSYLSWQLLQRLFASGLKTYWMGHGENPYKARWTDQGETLYRIEAYSPALRGRLLRMNRKLVRPAARRVLGTLRRAWRGAEQPRGSK